MGFQTLLTLLLTACSAAFILRSLFRTTRGKGCASGCGSCSSTTCALRKLEAQSREASNLTR